jgi:hypothetical protein
MATRPRAHRQPLPVSALSDDDAEAAAGPVAVPRGNGASWSGRVRVAVPSGNGVGGNAPRNVLPPSGRNGHTAVCVPGLLTSGSGPALDSDSDEAAGNQMTREQVRQKLLTVLRQMCNCGKRRERRGQRPGAKPQPLRMHCTTRLQNHLEECVEHRLAFMQMHYHMLFALLQKDGCPRPLPADGDGVGGRAPRPPCTYEVYVSGEYVSRRVCGERLCVQMCMKL